MTTDQVARFHVHLCPVCGIRVGCTSATCERRTASVAHPDHTVPEPTTFKGGRLDPPPIECGCCGERARIDTAHGASGRVVHVFCHACRGTTFLTLPTCVECGKPDTHADHCSFVVAWGV